ncbi:alanine racemase [Granulicoccus sp. GXG6511]|uniref:alanine racemase n=1 Tax=Granulicoccus sp. GXG6511 TaxID=3381351 RepID=UPI003D7EB803
MTNPVTAVIDPATASAEIDLAAFSRNVRALAGHVAPAELMVVVKADAYGHGMMPCARTARAAGASWLGVATPGEARVLREAGDTGRLFCWLFGEDEDLVAPIALDIDLGVHHPAQLSRVVAAAAAAGRIARVHLKIDTGLSRNGCPPVLWDDLCSDARAAQEAGAVEVVAVWSHFAAADEPEHPANPMQIAAFHAAVDRARAAGLAVPIRHLANSAAALGMPDARFELVRVGIAAYGVDPADGELAEQAGVPLDPVMRLRAHLIATRAVAPGTAVSYGHRWAADDATVLGLVPLGYADGIPRAASGWGTEPGASVAVAGRRAPIAGTVCMDQFVVDLGPDAREEAGDEVTLFGGADSPSASDWARVCRTIGYEIVTRIGNRVPRRYSGGAQ